MIKLPTATAYTVDEVAEIIHRTPDAVRKHIKAGRLKAQKVGRAWYVTEKTLTEFITGEKPEPRPKDDSTR